MKRGFALMATVSLLVLVLVLAGCGGDGGGSASADSPEAVTEAFIQASLDQDAEAAFELISESDQAEVDDKEQIVEGADEYFESFSVGKAEIEGDTAKVDVTIKIKELENELTFVFVLVEEDGKWKVSLEKTGEEMDKAFDKMMEESSE